MYSARGIEAFADFRLRRLAELDVLKLFFLFVARRDNKTNFANIGYGKIEEYTNIKRVPDQDRDQFSGITFAGPCRTR